MKCESVAKHFLDHLIHDLDAEQAESVQQHLDTCETCRAEYETLVATWEKLGRLPDIDPPASLRPRFESMLDAYQAGQQTTTSANLMAKLGSFVPRAWFTTPALRFGFSFAILLLGMFVGWQLRSGENPGSQELTVLREEVHSLSKLVALSLLQQPSSSERLRGIRYTSMVEQPDTETLTALLNTLNYDQTLNVRLAAVDALAMFYEKDEVRQGLIESLARQTSPLVQIALINLFVELDEKQSIETLKFISGNEVFNQTVRRKADWAIEQLK